MSVILAFLAAIITLAAWWLVRQGVMSKPWLETGPMTSMQAGPGGSIERVGLGVFLVVVGSLFALFGSAFVMRMDLETWSSLRLPPIVWANTVLLVLASLLLHHAVAATRHGDRSGHREAMIALVATAGFLIGQILAWREMAGAGDGLGSGPAASFFYLLSGLHGLHILGGLAALGLFLGRASEDAARQKRNLGLAVVYWDFLLVVWGGLLLLFMGWANRLVDICRNVLT